MNLKNIQKLLETGVVSIVGGFVFNLLNTPLPWVLGSLTFVVIWQGFTKKKLYIPSFIQDAGFIVLGIYFGLYFTMETIETVTPFFIPYIFATILLIMSCVIMGTLVTKWINVDKITSVYSCIPGGLSEMALASEQMNARASLVVIFQTIRLIAVLFIIPPIMVYFIGGTPSDTSTSLTVAESSSAGGFRYLLFLLPILAALFFKKKIPAGIIIGALGGTAILNISPIELATVPSEMMNAGQIAIGAGLGKNILFRDLKVGGKYTLVYFGLAVVTIMVSFGLGVVLSRLTSLDLATALLGMAPGGFFEMVLTAYNVGGDPAVVSALQLMRILIIVLFVPVTLKWWFTRKRV